MSVARPVVDRSAVRDGVGNGAGAGFHICGKRPPTWWTVVLNPWSVDFLSQPTSTSHEEVKARLETLVGDLGLDRFAFVLGNLPQSPRPGPLVTLTNFPPAWLERYARMRFDLIDPVLEAGFLSSRPFIVGVKGFQRGLRDAQRKMLDEARDHGLAFGLVVPVHSPGSPSGILIVTATDEDCLLAGVRDEAGRLWTAACDVRDHMVVRTATSPGPNEADRGLTPREKECLLWTAQGRTAREVGVILGVSAFTVNRHVSNATRKLGCENKYHAACEALLAGIIRPLPIALSSLDDMPGEE